MAHLVYILSALTSLLCATLLLRAHKQVKQALLFFSGLCFVGLTVSNVLVLVDLIVVPEIDLYLLRLGAAIVGMGLLLYGLIWEAQAELEKAYRAGLKHEREKQIDHLKKAVLIDPENVAARNNLGVCLAPIDPAAAITQFQEAIRVNPRKSLLFSNLAVGLVRLHDMAASERAARTAIELDRTGKRARALLGLVLYDQHKRTEETLGLLERSSDEYPLTHMFPAEMLLNRGEFQKARAHIREYLSTGETEYLNEASQMLEVIGKAQPPPPDQF